MIARNDDEQLSEAVSLLAELDEVANGDTPAAPMAAFQAVQLRKSIALAQKLSRTESVIANLEGRPADALKCHADATAADDC